MLHVVVPWMSERTSTQEAYELEVRPELPEQPCILEGALHGQNSL